MAVTLALPTSMNMECHTIPVINTKIENLVIGSKVKKSDDEPNNFVYAHILDQSTKRLSSLDAQRLVSVLEECVQRCEIVVLLPFVIENLERFSVSLGPELISALREHAHHQQMYMKTLQKVRKLRPPSTRSLTHDSMGLKSEDISLIVDDGYNLLLEEVKKLTDCISQSIRVIVRLFKMNPVSLSTIKMQRKQRSFESNLLIESLIRLREELYARLVTSANEEQEKLKMAVQILKKEKKGKVDIKKLESDLEKCSEEKKEMIRKKNEVILSLKSSISAIEQESEVVNRKMLNDAKKVEASDVKNSEVMQSKLQQDVIILKQLLQQNINKNRDDELQMRKRKFKIETEVENWLQKYDTDMTEKQDEFDDISAIYAEEKYELGQLEVRFEALEVEYFRIVEERRIAEEERLRMEEEMKKMVKAATLLQSFWRSYRCRKALKVKQKKGKKGKAGKKKKK